MPEMRASDEVIDAIAHIEVHRQGTEKESGVTVACHEALRKLNELLQQEQAAPEPHGPGSGYSANVEAVMSEIRRVRKLAGVTNQKASSKHRRHGQHQQRFKDNSRRPPKNKDRRTMGRRGER